ncbi:DUF2491 domain-containing protein [Vreelandella rituensis]|uniref:DUF2491 family protein n=1 Tax=Vreelandella rituensis TaxID=2282306 RepID=A0A368U9K4_9GAMM|nr:DUF2491 family protein [Halomonas rituensis]RCV93581.1 DUF2491 family protein [Halomonas rituensis]
MLSALKSLLRAGSKKEQAEHDRHVAKIADGLPDGMTPADFEGMRLDGMVSLDMLALKAHDAFRFDPSWSGEAHQIKAIGVVELGKGEKLTRFYLENDTWIQAAIEGDRVFEYKVFDFHAAQDVSDVEFDAIINNTDPADKNGVGASCYVLPSQEGDGTTYKRVWGAEDSAWSPPVILEETVTLAEGGIPSQVRHHCMLYERHLPEADRFEYVIISAEEDAGDGSYQLVTNLGVDIRALVIDAN